MKYLIVFIMCVLATAKMSFQSVFGKRSVRNTADAVFFNGLVFLFSAALFMYKIIDCSPAVWIYAAVGAAFSVIFQLAYTKALSTGNVSLTVLIVNFALVINVLVSYLVYNEPLSWVRLLGIILTLIAFILCTDFKTGQRTEKQWLLIALLAMLSNAAASIVQKVFGESEYQSQNQAYVSCAYLIAAVIVLIVYRIFKQSGEGKTFKVNRSTVLLVMAVGVSLAIFQGVNTYALSTIDGTFLFPAYSGGTIIFSTLSGVLIFKDRLNAKQTLSIIIGIVAVVLMNF